MARTLVAARLSLLALLALLALACASDTTRRPARSSADGASSVGEITYTPITEPPPTAALEETPLEPIESPPELADAGGIDEASADDSAPSDDAAPDAVGEGGAEALLAASLARYEQAQELWQRGELDAALDALDRAYEIMAEADVDDDAALLRQQEDLRRLIARRVVEVYASRRTVVGDANSAIPAIVNDHVQREIASFQGRERDEFLAGYRRSGLYRPAILEALHAAGLPEQLSWLPMVESWYKVRALSTARALGLWQFIASTGYRFGLRRTNWVDERMDPDKATGAALSYLTELHEMFGDWLTVIAAYNCGEARVLRTINRQRLSYFDQFWDLYEQLPRETRRYVPRFLAVLQIVEDPEAYGFTDLPEPLAPPATSELEIERAVVLDDLEKRLELERGALAALNPELRRGVTPDTTYSLRVPDSAESEQVLAAIEAIPVARPQPSPLLTGTSVHVVRTGESLSTIAQRYGVSTGTLAMLNGISDPDRLRVGQHLRVRGEAAGPATGGQPTTYTVRPGDSLWRIASRYGTTVDRLRRDNDLRGNTLRPGQRLRITGGSGGSVYVVRRGDTLGGIARAGRISTRQLAEANGLSLRSTIYPGQRLVIPGRD